MIKSGRRTAIPNDAEAVDGRIGIKNRDQCSDLGSVLASFRLLLLHSLCFPVGDDLIYFSIGEAQQLRQF